VGGSHWLGLSVRDRLKAVLSPEALKVTDLMPAADGCARLRPILKEQHIVSGVLGKASLASHRRNDSLNIERPPV
jgi:hypothetical protein